MSGSAECTNESAVSHSRVYKAGGVKNNKTHHRGNVNPCRNNKHQQGHAHAKKRHQSESTSYSDCTDTTSELCGMFGSMAREIPKEVLEKLIVGDFNPCSVDNFNLIEQKVCPSRPSLPHNFFPKPKRPRNKKACDGCADPKSPIVLAVDQGPSFNFLGTTFILKAGAFDTENKAELVTITLPPGTSQQTLINCTSDVFLVLISGQIVANVNCTDYIVLPGGFVYIHSGSPYSLSNTSLTTPATIFVGFLKAGTLGFYKQVADLQKTVGGPWNVDPCLVEEYAHKHFIYTGVGDLCLGPNEISFVPPGTIRFLPMPIENCEGKVQNTWGLLGGQILLISSVLPTPPSTPGIVKTSATVRGSDCEASIILEPTRDAIGVSAAVISDPSCGVSEALSQPKINGKVSWTLITGASYFVSFDSRACNVIVIPTDPRLRETFFAGQSIF